MNADEQAILLLVDRWMQASKAGDLETVLTMMTDDVVFMVPGREPFGKQAFAESNRQNKDVKIEGESKPIELKVLGDWAWMRNHLNLKITPTNGKTMTCSGYTLTILQKNANGAWQIARDANLMSAPK